MEGITLYEVLWTQGLEPTLIEFFMDLNWYYMIMLTVILYGFKHTNLLDWWVWLMGKIQVNKKYIYWTAAIMSATMFLLFRSLEGNPIDAAYISGMLRSIIFTIVFSNIFVDIPVYVIKGLSKFIDSKTKED
jgi:hypothetical protein